MKRLLISAACIALMGTSFAAAQTNQPARTDDMPAAVAPNTTGATDTDPTRAASSAGTLSHNGMGDSSKGQTEPGINPGTANSPGAGGAMAMNTGSISTAAMVGDETTSNPAPSSYPRCTHKGQDRCRTKG